MKPSSAKPQFFKPILPGFKNGLKIPTYFSTCILGETKEFRDEAVLKRKGKEWRVSVIGGHFVGDDWKRFAEDNNLEAGDFVVFDHQGKLVFSVIIFNGRTQCGRGPKEREICRPSEKSRFDSEIPHFIETVKQYSLNWGYITVPRPFARSNGLSDRRCKITVKDEQERSWCLDLFSRHGSIRIRGKSTWAEFFTANGFKKGDSYKFEVVVAGNREEPPVVRILPWMI